MNYVNEQNMQEILDGIARKIGQGGTGSGLEDWQASHEYAENDIFVYSGQIYKSIVDFESDTTFSVIQILEEYELQGGETPIAYVKGTDIVVDDIVSYDSNYYKALYDFTCGEEFGLYAFEQYTPQELTEAQENEIIQHWNNVIGDKVGIKIPVEVQAVRQTLFEGFFNTVNSPLQLSDSIENYDQFELCFANGLEGQEASMFTYDTENIDYSKTYLFRIYNAQDTSYRYSVSSSFSDATHFRIDNIVVNGWSNCYLTKIVGIKYINPNTYSTEEQIVGKWIDGKPLYQITVNKEFTETVVDNVDYQIAFVNDSIDYAIITSIVINKVAYPIFSVANAFLRKSTGYLITKFQQTSINPVNSICITLQYTKTTD